MKKTDKIELVCKNCGKTFYTYPCYIRKGGGKFCSRSCSTTYRNLTDNPAKRPDVRIKISQNHADISGIQNPMYGRVGNLSPSYIDGRSKFKGEQYRKIMLAESEHPACSLCGETDIKRLHVHHLDKNRRNNSKDNLIWVCVMCHNNILHKRERDKLGKFIPIYKMEVV